MLVANDIRHLCRRNGVYYYERRVPQRVKDVSSAFDAFFGGQPLYRVSLRTKVQTEAMERAIEITRAFEARVRAALGDTAGPLPVRSSLPARDVTETVLAKIVLAQRGLVARPYRTQRIVREGSKDGNAEYERMMDEFEQEAEHIKAVCIDMDEPNHPKFDVSQIAEDIVESERLNAPLNSFARAEVVSAVRQGMLAGYTDVGDILQGKAIAHFSTVHSRKRKAPLISEVVGSYLSRKVRKRTINEIKGALAAFLSSVGDLPLDEIDRSHFQRFCGAEGSKDIGGKSANSVNRPMSAATLRKKVALLRAAINQAIERGEYEGENPAAKLNPVAFTRPVPRWTMPRKRPFTVEELNVLFAYPWFVGCRSASEPHQPGDHRLSGMHYWVPILAMFTGCRAGELGGLMLSEVREKGSYPHLRIQDNKFRSTKKGYSRNIPLLDHLVELGFNEFVAAARMRGQTRLFEDWRPPAARTLSDDLAWSNGAMIRSFNHTVLPKVFPDMLRPGVRRELTFHSFRGAFKSMLGLLRHQIPVNYIHEVVGHAKPDLEERYTGEIPLEETYPAIHGRRFAGLIVPPAPT